MLLAWHAAACMHTVRHACLCSWIMLTGCDAPCPTPPPDEPAQPPARLPACLLEMLPTEESVTAPSMQRAKATPRSAANKKLPAALQRIAGAPACPALRSLSCLVCACWQPCSLPSMAAPVWEASAP